MLGVYGVSGRVYTMYTGLGCRSIYGMIGLGGVVYCRDRVVWGGGVCGVMVKSSVL